jgi:hypothetical protein
MLETLLSWFKRLFGGEGSSQIGMRNRTVSGASAGNNSPVVAAGRDVHFHISSDSASED